MKKILISLSALAAMSSIVNADMFRLEMGGGVWNQTPSGTMSYSDGTLATFGIEPIGTYTSNENDSNDAYLWMLLKHPIPIIPNLRLEYTSISDDGVLSGSFNDFPTPAPANTPTTLDMTQFDIIPYYNILDNTLWTTIDLGLDIKVHETKYNVSATTGYDGYSGSETIFVPLVYGRVRVEIPGTGIGLESDLKYITYDGSTVYDFRAKVDYTFDFDIFVDPGIEIGYRMQKFDIDYEDGSDHTIINTDYSGVYAGLMVRF
jgi:outer membrane protein